MPSIIETTVFTYDELSESAKETARQWFRSLDCDGYWSDSVIEDAKECGALIGITIDKVFFSGFSSQGDGACFEGSYKYRKAGWKEIAAYTGNNAMLMEIAADLQEIQRKAFYRLTASVKHSGHYYHEYCTNIDVYNNGEYVDSETDKAICEGLRHFMKWIYRQLERSYDDYSSDENIAENIRINEYTFTEDGRRFG